MTAYAGQSVQLDLQRLQEKHPLLPAATASELATQAAIVLQRRQHRPGVGMVVVLSGAEGPSSAILDWDPVDMAAESHLDPLRATEYAAEAVSLALVSAAFGWVALRRLQRGEGADWLLKDPGGALVALEVTGVDGDADGRRTAEKLEQIRKANVGDLRFVCAVAFSAPAAHLVRANGRWT